MRLPPVKSLSLLLFKSVCKSSWRAFHANTTFNSSSSSKSFCKSSWRALHTSNSSKSSSSKFGTFILQTIEHSREEYYIEGEIKMFMLSSSGDGDGDDDGEDGNDDDHKMVFKVDDLGFFPFYKDYLLTGTLRMVGSCNGIICLHDPMLLDSSKGPGYQQHYLNLRDVSLWNPATRQFRILPKSIPIEEKQDYIGNFLEDFVAFGFDVKTKDYKVLRITTFTPWDESTAVPVREEGGCMCRVQVYSLSTDSWRLLEGINYLPVVPCQHWCVNHGIYLNGSYFFVGTKFVFESFDSMMLSFDFTKEIFTTMQLPDNCNRHKLVLSYLGEKLAVFTTPRIDDDCDDDGYEYYDIWVLNEQQGSGCKESWTKLNSFRMKSRGKGNPYIEPRCISNNGEFALISTRRTDDDGGWWRYKLQLFNLVTKEAKTDFTIGYEEFRADVYNESQVSIMGGNVLLRWQLPTHGTCYKLNLDAPFIDHDSSFGIGLCLTSDTGGCIGVRSVKGYARDAQEGEALAIIEAIKWAKKLELSPIIIESDSKNCVSFFMEDDNNSTYWSSGALSLLWEAKFLLNSSTELGSISFQYCSRSCNYVADIAAKLGREGDWVCKDWTANFPGEMVMSLSKDLGLETKEGSASE